MTETTPTTEDERLVAYLDGELDDAAAVQVEQLLASNPEVRAKVDKLSRTYDLLDLLPSSRASQEFTNKTLTAVRARVRSEQEEPSADEAASTQIKVPTKPLPNPEKWRTIRMRVLAFLGLMLAAAAGFHSSYDFGRSEQEELLRNYPLIRKLEEYRSIRDPQLLKELHERKTFGRRGPNDERDDRKAN